VPIFNRNFTTFQLLSPGAQIQGWGHAASENPQGSRQILTNGQHFAGTGFELDGTDNQDPILGIIVINPNLDSINEVKITSQDYDAEFGKAIGAIVTSQTKSGTNEYTAPLLILSVQTPISLAIPSRRLLLKSQPDSARFPAETEPVRRHNRWSDQKE